MAEATTKSGGVKYVAVQDLDWCGVRYTAGQKVPITNKGTARDLLRRKLIEEKK